MTSGGKWKPLKVERGTGAGGGRRILRSGVSLLKAVVANATAPVRLQEMEPEESVPALRRGEVDIAIGHAYDLVPRDLPVGCERHDLLADPVAAVLPLTDSGYGEPREVAFPEQLYSCGPAGNPEWDQPHVRVAYTSFVTPPSIYDHDVLVDVEHVAAPL